MPTLNRPAALSREQSDYLQYLEREGDYMSLIANVAHIHEPRRSYSPSEVLAAYEARDMNILQHVLTNYYDSDWE